MKGDPTFAINAKFKLLAHYDVDEEIKDLIKQLMVNPLCRLL